jgi:hypothetical protein
MNVERTVQQEHIGKLLITLVNLVCLRVLIVLGLEQMIVILVNQDFI